MTFARAPRIRSLLTGASALALAVAAPALAQTDGQAQAPTQTQGQGQEQARSQSQAGNCAAAVERLDQTMRQMELSEPESANVARLLDRARAQADQGRSPECVATLREIQERAPALVERAGVRIRGVEPRQQQGQSGQGQGQRQDQEGQVQQAQGQQAQGQQDQSQTGESAEIRVDQQPPQIQIEDGGQREIHVTQQPADVQVELPAPEIVVQQQPPTVTVVQPDPKVTVSQAEPKVVIRRQGTQPTDEESQQQTGQQQTGERQTGQQRTGQQQTGQQRQGAAQAESRQAGDGRTMDSEIRDQAATEGDTGSPPAESWGGANDGDAHAGSQQASDGQPQDRPGPGREQTKPQVDTGAAGQQAGQSHAEEQQAAAQGQTQPVDVGTERATESQQGQPAQPQAADQQGQPDRQQAAGQQGRQGEQGRQQAAGQQGQHQTTGQQGQQQATGQQDQPQASGRQADEATTTQRERELAGPSEASREEREDAALTGQQDEFRQARESIGDQAGEEATQLGEMDERGVDQEAALPPSGADEAVTLSQFAEKMGVQPDKLIGMNVEGAEGDGIGEIMAILRNQENKLFMLVETTDFLGFGDELAAVPIEKFSMGQDGETLLLEGMTEEDVEQQGYDRTNYDILQ